MDITELKWPVRRRPGRYSDEFKREIVKACQAPGVSTASVAVVVKSSRRRGDYELAF
jgi:hypothetical protein